MGDADLESLLAGAGMEVWVEEAAVWALACEAAAERVGMAVGLAMDDCEEEAACLMALEAVSLVSLLMTLLLLVFLATPDVDAAAAPFFGEPRLDMWRAERGKELKGAEGESALAVRRRGVCVE